MEVKNEYFDLSLRKSITSVEYPDKEDSKITEEGGKTPKHSFPYFVILACSYCMLLIQCGEVQTYQLSGF